ncbi:MAG TPA: helicase C-terminal domain-containing protein [Anaerolineaceae bacterium]|nr:helicase C-terminal domain-containing protein [Anaerolineaceae bacterium]
MPSMVAIDIETTGLDPQKDAIIEIAAIRFNGRRVEAEWSKLINPGRPIPRQITQLTGITDEMVRHAPPINAVIQELSDFIGDDPVLGHNVRFDLSFLQKQRILNFNRVVDTYELAAIALPGNSRYKLGTLGQTLGILIPNSHRALDDARLTQAVYYTLTQKLLELPIEILDEIMRMAEGIEWDGELAFRQALQEKGRMPVEAKKVVQEDFGLLFGGVKNYPPLVPVETPAPLDPEEMAAQIEHGGPFSKYFDNFESRPQQLEMLRSVANALSNSQHLMVEAGTGTGKSFAYLIAAVEWAVRNSMRVVISTNTITLQDQLIKKDIPDLAAALGSEVLATVVKGRNNYLCPRRYSAMRKNGPENADELRVLAKTLVWLYQGGSGDRGEINLNGLAEREVWNRLSAEDEGCRSEVCISRTGGACPFHRTHMAAQSSHILVINHALLLADVMTGNRVLPEYNYLIVDEAHHLESATTNALSYRISQSDLVRLLREVGSVSSGLLGRLLTLLSHSLPPSDFASLNMAVHKISDLTFKLENDFSDLIRNLETFMEEHREGQPISGYGQQTRILPATRTLPSWSDVEISWDECQSTLDGTLKLLANFQKSINDGLDEIPEGVEDALGSLASVHLRLSEAQKYVDQLVNNPEPDMVYWVEQLPNNYRLSMQAAPLHIGPLMEQYLWHEKASVILTSATLTTNNEFDYMRNRLNADEADELVLGSPFDFENSTLLYLVNDIPEPNEANAYQREVESAIIRLAKATGGRMLALFTSYAQLKRTAQAIGPAMADAGIEVYEQGEGASPNTLLETFREADKAVLLGTRAFWEGVDIPGEALSVLVIVKLPFDVPSDPIIAARAETFEDAFNEYNIPEAILRFRQGFGRLIRTQSDRGVVVILDKRVLTKKYGRQFLDSIPLCTRKVASSLELPSATVKWLNI